MREHVLLGATIAGDLAVRTGLASLLGAGFLSSTLRSDVRAQTRRLAAYAELAEHGDQDRVFVAPEQRVPVGEQTDDVASAGGRIVTRLAFASPYEPLLAPCSVRPRVSAQLWRHRKGPRETLCVIHGFGAASVRVNRSFFALEDYFAGGWDILLYTLPYHGTRAPAGIDGLGLFSHGVAGLHEAVLRSIFDLRILLDHLFETGAPRVGVTGLSLGGYLSALLACVEPRLDFVVPNVPVVWMPGLLSSWTPANLMFAGWRRAFGPSLELLERSFAIHSPLTYMPRLARDRMLIVAGIGDRLAPPEQSRKLWEHWDRPALEWFAGSHLLHFGRARYRERIWRLMSSRH